MKITDKWIVMLAILLAASAIAFGVQVYFHFTRVSDIVFLQGSN
jgi:hypothetical protein